MQTKENVTLRQSLSMFQVVFLGLAWMTPMIYFSVYGIAYDMSHGRLAETYALALLAIGFTARSYGVMARMFPISGSAYTFTKKAIHPYLGFLVGWALLLDYLFSPIIACLTFGIYINAQFPSIPAYVWIIALNVAITGCNLLGIQFSAHLSKLFVLLQIVFIAVFCGFLVKGLLGAPATQAASFFDSGISITALLAGTSVICFSFLGFDTVTTLSEETVNAGKNIPRAIMLIILIAGVVYLIPSLLTQLVYPNGLVFDNLESAGLEVVKLVGGAALGAVFLTVLLMAIFTQGLTSVTSVSRLLYVMGRDGSLPAKLFGYLNPKSGIPVVNVLTVAVISLLAVEISLETAVKFVSFGALTAFVFVNVSVIAECYVRRRMRSIGETVRYLLFPLIGAAFIFWLLSLMGEDTLVFGCMWVVLGALYSMTRSVWNSREEARRMREQSLLLDEEHSGQF